MWAFGGFWTWIKINFLQGRQRGPFVLVIKREDQMGYKFTGWAITAVVFFGTSNVYAGGADITLMPTDMLFEDGGENGAYAEISVGRISPDVTGTNAAPTGSMYPDFTATTLAVKMDLNDQISLGYANYLSAAILVDYRNAGAVGNYAAISPGSAFVDLEIRSQLLAAKYLLGENMSVFGGLKYSETSDATANVLKNPRGSLTIPSASDTAFALGLAYEMPEIALRASGLYQTKTEFDLPMSSSAFPSLINGKGALPESFTLRFQTGIAEDTLAFGSIHRANWADSQIEFETDVNGTGNLTGSLAARSTFTTTNVYSLGIGRKISEELSISGTYSWEEGSGPTDSSLLSTTDGKKTVSLGGKYTKGSMTLSAGYSYTQFGDYTSTGTVTGVPGMAASVFTDNSSSAVGIKVGFAF